MDAEGHKVSCHVQWFFYSVHTKTINSSTRLAQLKLATKRIQSQAQIGKEENAQYKAKEDVLKLAKLDKCYATMTKAILEPVLLLRLHERQMRHLQTVKEQVQYLNFEVGKGGSEHKSTRTDTPDQSRGH